MLEQQRLRTEVDSTQAALLHVAEAGRPESRSVPSYLQAAPAATPRRRIRPSAVPTEEADPPPEQPMASRTPDHTRQAEAHPDERLAQITYSQKKRLQANGDPEQVARTPVQREPARGPENKDKEREKRNSSGVKAKQRKQKRETMEWTKRGAPRSAARRDRRAQEKHPRMLEMWTRQPQHLSMLCSHHQERNQASQGPRCTDLSHYYSP